MDKLHPNDVDDYFKDEMPSNADRQGQALTREQYYSVPDVYVVRSHR